MVIVSVIVPCNPSNACGHLLSDFVNSSVIEVMKLRTDQFAVEKGPEVEISKSDFIDTSA
jgi:hypothetical protein